MLRRSHFAEHVQAILLQGIAVAGFNVIDIHTLARKSGVPVLVVARHQPDMKALHHALSRGSGAERKWRLIERAGPMEPMRGVFVQRAGLSSAHAEHLLAATTLHGKLPEAIRLAHLVAGGITTGTSRGRA